MPSRLPDLAAGRVAAPPADAAPDTAPDVAPDVASDALSAAALREVVYRLPSTVRGAWPGRHRSAGGDGGFEFRAHVPLVNAPDARRLDLLASLREPFGQWLVRVHSQRLAIPVVMVADLSASMASPSSAADAADGAGQGGTATVLADMAHSLAWSAWKSGDSFGFFGCGPTLAADWTLLPGRGRGAGLALAQRLRHHVPAGHSAEGLLQVAPLLGRRRALVFLASDFHLPLPLLDAVLTGLAGHEVVPVVLARPDDADLGPRHGLAPLHDAETGARRLLWWRPALRARWQAERLAGQQALAALFARHRRSPVHLPQGFDADALTRHFQA